MLTTRIIPCLDVKNGRVVKGVKFSSIRDAGDPAECAAAYERQGADEIVILDISATNEQRDTQVETVRAVREQLSIPLTVGGGVRKTEDAARLLAAGADKVACNSAAVANPEIVRLMAEQFGRQCTVVAIDAARTAAGNWEVVTHGGSKRQSLDVVQWALAVESLGAGEILLTSWDRDGTKEGYDTDLLSAVTSAISIPVIASGGAQSPDHFIDAVRAGAHALLAASIFHFGETTVSELKSELAKEGIEVRQ